MEQQKALAGKVEIFSFLFIEQWKLTTWPFRTALFLFWEKFDILNYFPDFQWSGNWGSNYI